DGVPTWDGSASTFQAYEEQVLVWEQGVKYENRYLCGPRLCGELSGAAQRMIVGKPPTWVSFNGGVAVFLRHLRQSLGRPQIPEATEFLNKYFRNSRRRVGEGINDYITRKTETYWRACQALKRVMNRKPTSATTATPPSTSTTSWYEPSYQGWPDQSSRRSSWASTTSNGPGADGDGENEETRDEHSTDEAWTRTSSTWSSWSWGSYRWDSYPSYSSWDWRQRAEQPAAMEEQVEILPEFVQAWYLLAAAREKQHQVKMARKYYMPRDKDRVVRHVRVLRISVMWLVSILVLIFPFLDVEQQPRRTTMPEASVNAQSSVSRSSFLSDSKRQAMMRMNKAQLQDAIRARGEEPPREWSNVELRDRLTELMELNGETTSGTKKTDLRQWIAELNKNSKKKELLKTFCEVSVASAMDPVGFGKWSTLTYGQLRREQPAYATWVQETLLEGGESCDYRLSRLGNWLMNQPDEETVEVPEKMPPTTIEPAYAKPKAKAKSMTMEYAGGKGYGAKTVPKGRSPMTRDAPASSSSAEDASGSNAEAMKLLMDTMVAMKEEIKQLREDRHPEEPRRKKKEEPETDAKASTEASFTMVPDP
ncbi:unnamed protein product, partial [Symbiodinium microadriaticum]